MKRLFLALIFLFAGTGSYAVTPATVNLSSYTATNESAYISSSAYINKVLVTVTSAGGVLVIYNSTFTTSGVVVSSISLATIQNVQFDDTQVKGIFYKTTSNTNGVTIIYKK